MHPLASGRGPPAAAEGGQFKCYTLMDILLFALPPLSPNERIRGSGSGQGFFTGKPPMSPRLCSPPHPFAYRGRKVGEGESR